mgnify:FL=1
MVQTLWTAICVVVGLSVYIYPIGSLLILLDQRTKDAFRAAIASGLLTIAQLFVLLPAVQ